MATRDSAHPSESTRRVLPWLVAVAFFIETLDATILNTAVPKLAEDLGVEPLSLKAVLTSYALSLAVLIPASGWVADRLGTRRTFALAMGLFALGSLACGLSANLPMLVVSRLVQGAGGALMIPVGRIALVRTYPRSELLRTMNFVIIPGLLGPLMGPLIGGLIVHWLPWQAIFFINLPICAAGIVAAWRHMPDYRAEARANFDGVGFLLFGGGLGLLAYALEVVGEHKLSWDAIGGLATLGLSLLIGYGLHARLAARPLLELGLFRVRTFRVSVVGGFITRLGFAGTPFLLPLLYQIGMGFPPWKAGLLMMPAPGAAILMKLAATRILRRLGHRWALRINTVLLGCVVASYSLVGPGSPLALILSISFLQGLFASLQFTSANSLAYADVPDERASAASTIASAGQQMSMSFGVAIASALALLFLGGLAQRDPALIVPGLHRAFWILGGLTVLSSLAFLALRPDDGNTISNRVSRVIPPAAPVGTGPGGGRLRPGG